jgi:predicted Zn-dependent protease
VSVRGLSGQGTDGSDRILSAEECEAIGQRVFAFARGGGETRVGINSWWNGELRWARNRVSLAADRRSVSISVSRALDVGSGEAETNQLDDVSLEAVVRAAERTAQVFGSFWPKPALLPPLPPLDTRQPPIWSDASYNFTTEARGQSARALIAPAEAKQLLSAGYLEMHASSKARLSSLRPSGPFGPWDQPYVAWTQAQCSMTVRDTSGTASGWAGLSSYDWDRINAEELAARAVEKCVASQHPVALEPGRYTVILEPQAVADLMDVLVRSLRRETNGGPWVVGYDDALQLWRYKLGLKVVDRRVTISHDPMAAGMGILNEPGMDMGPVTWIDDGVLTNLGCTRDTAVRELNRNLGTRYPTGYRISGGHTSMDEMVRTTRRGLLVTRFWHVGNPNDASLTVEGFTRDGLWLIEDGKITKAVRNFQFTESPVFVLNNLDQLGEPVPVFHPSRPGLSPVMVPPLKAHDFSFTSLIDAI